MEVAKHPENDRKATFRFGQQKQEDKCLLVPSASPIPALPPEDDTSLGFCFVFSSSETASTAS